MANLFVLFIGLLLSTNTFAHAGHDHGDPMAGLIHILWVAPLAISAVFLFLYVKQRFIKK